MNKIDVLEDTIKYYSENPKRRAYKSTESTKTQCAYYDKDTGNRCAVGRLLSLDLARALSDENQVVVDIIHYLPKEVQELGAGFLQDLQYFHDMKQFWTETGLTEEGENMVKSLREKYALESTNSPSS